MGRTLREPVADAVLERVATYLRRAADGAAGEGRRVAVEMHLTIGADAALVSRLLDLVDRPTAGVIYDPANLYLAGRPYRLSADPRAGRPRGAHLPRPAQGRRPGSAPPRPISPREPTLRFGGDFDLLLGEGRVDLRGALADLGASGYGGWYSVETHALPRPGLDSAVIAAGEIHTLRRLLRPS